MSDSEYTQGLETIRERIGKRNPLKSHEGRALLGLLDEAVELLTEVQLGYAQDRKTPPPAILKARAFLARLGRDTTTKGE